MSIKIQRYQSEEAGPFGKLGRKRASIKIPGSAGFTDLENSSVVLRMTANCTANLGQGGAAGGTLIPVVFGERVGGVGPISNGGAAALIKNAKVTADSNSKVNNSQQDQNVVNGNLDYYLKTRAEEKAMDAYNGGGDFNSGRATGIQNSPFLFTYKPTDFTTDVTTQSVHIQAEVHIPLKHVDSFARNIRQFPNIAVGDMTYEIEFETYKDVITNSNPIAGIILMNLAAGDAWGSATNPILWRARAGDANFKASDLDVNPFYVGCPLQITLTDSTAGGGGATVAYSTIASLKVNGARIEIVLTTPIIPSGGVNNGATATAITAQLDVADNATFAWAIQDVYLEMYQLQLTKTQFDRTIEMTRNLSIPWTEYRIQKKTMTASNFYADNVLVEPMCIGMAIITPQNNRLVSSLDLATRYRYTIDGTPVDDRDIPLGAITSGTAQGAARQMQNHKLMQFYKNIGQTLKRFDLPRLDFNGDLNEQTHHIYPLILPAVNKSQIVNIEVNASGNMASKDVYFVMIYQRELKFKNGKAV